VVALVAALLLDDLDEHDLPTADHLLDLVLAHQPPAAARKLLLHDVVFVIDGGRLLVLFLGGGAGAALGLVPLVLGLGLRLLAQQRFAVGDRDLVVVGMDFVEGQEAVAVAAILDKGRLQRRLNARHLGEIDIAPELLSVLALEIKFFNAVPIEHHHARLFGVGGVDQHGLRHQTDLRGARWAVGPGAASWLEGRARGPGRRVGRLDRPGAGKGSEQRCPSGVFLRRPQRGADRTVRRRRQLVGSGAGLRFAGPRPANAEAGARADFATGCPKRKAMRLQVAAERPC
jgi:hypothetical protein